MKSEMQYWSRQESACLVADTSGADGSGWEHSAWIGSGCFTSGAPAPGGVASPGCLDRCVGFGTVEAVGECFVVEVRQ